MNVCSRAHRAHSFSSVDTHLTMSKLALTREELDKVRAYLEGDGAREHESVPTIAGLAVLLGKEYKFMWKQVKVLAKLEKWAPLTANIVMKYKWTSNQTERLLQSIRPCNASASRIQEEVLPELTVEQVSTKITTLIAKPHNLLRILGQRVLRVRSMADLKSVINEVDEEEKARKNTAELIEIGDLMYFADQKYHRSSSEEETERKRREGFEVAQQEFVRGAINANQQFMQVTFKDELDRRASSHDTESKRRKKSFAEIEETGMRLKVQLTERKRQLLQSVPMDFQAAYSNLTPHLARQQTGFGGYPGTGSPQRHPTQYASQAKQSTHRNLTDEFASAAQHYTPPTAGFKFAPPPYIQAEDIQMDERHPVVSSSAPMATPNSAFHHPNPPNTTAPLNNSRPPSVLYSNAVYSPAIYGSNSTANNNNNNNNNTPAFHPPPPSSTSRGRGRITSSPPPPPYSSPANPNQQAFDLLNNFGKQLEMVNTAVERGYALHQTKAERKKWLETNKAMASVLKQSIQLVDTNENEEVASLQFGYVNIADSILEVLDNFSLTSDVPSMGDLHLKD